MPFLVRLERNSISSNCVVTVWPDFKKRLFERVDSLLIILLVLSVQVCGRVAGVMCFKFVLNVCLGVCMRACDLIPLLQCVLFQSWFVMMSWASSAALNHKILNNSLYCCNYVYLFISRVIERTSRRPSLSYMFSIWKKKC